MFAHILAAIGHFARSARRQRYVVLQLMTLEERAVPAANPIFSVDPPEMITVAELTTIKPIVRIDFVPFGCGAKPDNNFEFDRTYSDSDLGDQLFVTDEQPAQDESAEKVTESPIEQIVVSEADLLAAKMTEDLRHLASVGA